MGLRPAKCYRRMKRPYTRQSHKKPKKGYVKGVPKPKISSFQFGKQSDYSATAFLLSGTDIQIRHNALESSRISVIQHLEKNLGKGSKFFFRIRTYPHHVMRENALATGAGADRFQTGMRRSFGKPIGTSARVKKNQIIMEVMVDKSNIDIAKHALKKASYKLPTACKIVVEVKK